MTTQHTARNVTSARVVTGVGRYSLTSTEETRQVHVYIATEDGIHFRASELFPLEDDEAEHLNSWDFEKALDLIEARAKHYWINTGREKTLAAVEAMRPLVIPATRFALKQVIADLDVQRSRLQVKLNALDEEAA